MKVILVVPRQFSFFGSWHITSHINSLISESLLLFKFSLQIRIIGTPRRANAVTHFPPAIVYGNSKVEPSPNGDLDWRLSVPRRMQNKTFFRPATPPRRWVVFMFHGAVDQQSAELAFGF